MKIITTIILGLLLCISLFGSDETIVNQAKETLPHTGILMQQDDGFVYLKVTDEYINTLYGLIDDKSFTQPPYFRRHNSPGAHISVLYEKEAKSAGSIPSLGESFTFTIKDVARVKGNKKEFFIIQVLCPELEQYRKSLGLNPKLQGHEFHITIAVRNTKKTHSHKSHAHDSSFVEY